MFDKDGYIGAAIVWYCGLGRPGNEWCLACGVDGMINMIAAIASAELKRFYGDRRCNLLRYMVM